MSVKPAPMTHSPTPRPSTRWLVAAVALAAVAGLLWRFPLVRIRRLDATATKSTFDPRDFAERHWANDLLPALDAARDAGEVMAAIRRDATEACRSLGRSVGLSRSCLYLVRGQGTIAEVGPSGCRVTLDGDAGEVLLATGLVFGTAIRDVTGTVDPAARTDSRELAAAASEINRLVQERVIARLASDAKTGGRVEFVACGQVQGKLPQGKPWKLTPVRITLQEAPTASEGTGP
jgi:predicted lipoprotein